MIPYTCKPMKKNRSTILLSFALIVFGVLSLAMARHLNPHIFGQVIGVVLLMGAIQISTKYVLSDYSYFWDGETLTFRITQAKRAKTCACIPLNAACRLFSEDEWKREKNNYRIKTRLSYCQNLSPHPCSYLVFSDEKEDAFLIRFEPDDTLFSLLRNHLEQIS